MLCHTECEWLHTLNGTQIHLVQSPTESMQHFTAAVFRWLDVWQIVSNVYLVVLPHFTAWTTGSKCQDCTHLYSRSIHFTFVESECCYCTIICRISQHFMTGRKWVTVWHISLHGNFITSLKGSKWDHTSSHYTILLYLINREWEIGWFLTVYRTDCQWTGCLSHCKYLVRVRQTYSCYFLSTVGKCFCAWQHNLLHISYHIFLNQQYVSDNIFFLCQTALSCYIS